MRRGSTALKIVATMALLSLSLALSAAAETIHNIPCGNAANFNAALLKDSAGNFYGTSQWGGGGSGTVFEVSPNGQGGFSCTILYTFMGQGDGADPESTLVMDGQGNLYGTTTAAGSFGAGTVFELSRNGSSWSISRLYQFTVGDDGGYPLAGVILDAAGNLYGTTTQGGTFGGGVVYKLTPTSNGWTQQTLHAFAGGNDGAVALGGLIFDRAGNLYGTTTYGGSGQHGVVFKLHPAGGGWLETILHTFNTTDGEAYPRSSLTSDTTGALYGTTDSGGVFKLMPPPTAVSAAQQGWAITWLYHFPGGADGRSPNGALVFDGSGNLYGTTYYGGNLADCSPDGCGLVYELSPPHNDEPAPWTETMVWAFTGGGHGRGPPRE